MREEIWKTIPQYEDYEASCLGNIRNAKTKTLVKPYPGGTGYLCIKVQKIPKKVHQMVAAAFHGQRPENMVTRHLDGNKYNNSSSNLAYGFTWENHLDMVKKREETGVGVIKGKLDPKKAQKVWELWFSGYNYQGIADQMGLSDVGVYYIISGRNWREYAPEFWDRICLVP